MVVSEHASSHAMVSTPKEGYLIDNFLLADVIAKKKVINHKSKFFKDPRDEHFNTLSNVGTSQEGEKISFLHL